MTLGVVRRIAECEGYDLPFRGKAFDTIKVHRIVLNLPPGHLPDIVAIADFHRGKFPDEYRSFTPERRPRYELGALPYAFLVGPDAVVEQGAPLSRETPHAWRWNSRSLGVAVWGDFREHRPTHEQYNALIQLLAGIVLVQRLQHAVDPEIHGHTEYKAPKPTRLVGHDCPGRHLNLDEVRRDVRNLVGVHVSDFRDEWGLAA